MEEIKVSNILRIQAEMIGEAKQALFMISNMDDNDKINKLIQNTLDKIKELDQKIYDTLNS